MNLNNTVWELDGESGNFGWFVKRYIEKLVEEKFTSANSGHAAIAKCAKAVDAHWREFGPEHGFGELMDHLYAVIRQQQQ